MNAELTPNEKRAAGHLLVRVFDLREDKLLGSTQKGLEAIVVEYGRDEMKIGDRLDAMVRSQTSWVPGPGRDPRFTNVLRSDVAEVFVAHARRATNGATFRVAVELVIDELFQRMLNDAY